MSRKSDSPPLSGLSQTVEKALENFHDALWLGQKSPLAKPYFLHNRLHHHPPLVETSALYRGELLQKLFYEAHDALYQAKDNDLWRIINIYLNRHDRSIDKILKNLSPNDKKTYIATRTFRRKKSEAMQQLGEMVIKLIKPAWRLENPKIAPILIGREHELKLCQAALQQQKTIGLSGFSGLGKTSLGRSLAGDNFFWFTLRPGLNDQLYSLFFELAHFLKLKLPTGSVLFNELSTLSPHDKLDYSVMLGYLRNDIATLPQPRPIFCFDEVDLPETDFTDGIFHFLAKDFTSLAIPTLFMGQRVPFQTDIPIELSGLTLAHLSQWLAQQDTPPLTESQREQLHQLTQGNPLWLELFITLFKLGDQNILSHWEQHPEISYLLDRLLQRLNEKELAALCELVVFDRPAPQDVWPDKVIASLVSRRLAQVDNSGGVYLMASLRPLVYQQLPKGDIRLYHDNAAAIWASRGQYTEMLYHATQGNNNFLSESIWLWHQHQQLEIEQGQAAKALRVLESLDSNELDSTTQAVFSHLRAELHKLLGNYDQAKQIALNPLSRHPYIKTNLDIIRADINRLQSDYHTARKLYQTSLQSLERLTLDKVLISSNLRWIEQREQNQAQAWHYAKRAHYEVEKMYGSLCMNSNKLHEATQHFYQALTLAQELHYEEEEAKVNELLALTLTDLADFNASESHFHTALKIYQRIGRKTHLANIQVNMAYMYNLAKNWPKSLDHAHQAHILYKELNELGGIIVSTQNIAEAQFHLGHLDEAAKYAHEVYQTEDSEAMPHCTWLLGEISLQRDDLATAEKWLHLAFQIATENENVLIQGYAQRSLGKVYLARQEFDKAKSALEHALTLLHDSPHELPEIHELLQQIT